MQQPLTSYESDEYEYEIHHPTKPLILSEGNKWTTRYNKRKVFYRKEEAFTYLNSIRHRGKVIEIYYINNFYKGWFNSVMNLREVTE